MWTNLAGVEVSRTFWGGVTTVAMETGKGLLGCTVAVALGWTTGMGAIWMI